VASLSPFAGGDSFCALLTSGGVDCWGYGLDGELGDGSDDDSDVPAAIEGVGGSGTLGDVVSLSSGTYGSCANLTSGGVDCWGYGPDGELGDGSYSSSDVPAAVEGVGP
jgi:alpha-tubulin suppressor-like RCC1 family protein